MVKLLLLLTVFLTGTIAGLHTGSALFFNPAIDSLPHQEQIAALKAMEKVFNPAIPMLMATMGVAAVILPFLLKKNKLLFQLAVFAAVCLAIQTVTTLLINVPINNQVAQIDPLIIPSDWEETRSRWNSFNHLRTALLNVAFFSYLFGLISLYIRGKNA